MWYLICMLKTLKLALFLIIGSFLSIGGAFVTIAGAVSGFGNPHIIMRTGIALAGLAVLALGIYFCYIGSNKNLTKLLEDFLFVIFRN